LLLYLYCRVKTHIFLSPELLSEYSLNVLYFLKLCEYSDKISGWKYSTAGNRRLRVLCLANFVEEAKSWRKKMIFNFDFVTLEMTWLLFFLKPDDGLK